VLSSIGKSIDKLFEMKWMTAASLRKIRVSLTIPRARENSLIIVTKKKRYPQSLANDKVSICMQRVQNRVVPKNKTTTFLFYEIIVLKIFPPYNYLCRENWLMEEFHLNIFYE